ncbi:MAG: hypothetical protein E7Z64_04545 [Thermoplasmata archaeon]|nr:hypothetical protein [Thermoplasmata archaeon]
MNTKVIAILVVAVLAVCAVTAVFLMKGDDDDDKDGTGKTTDFSLLSDDKIAPGMTVEVTTSDMGMKQTVKHVVTSVEDNKVYCDQYVNGTKSSNPVNYPVDMFFFYTLKPIEETDFPEGTKTSTVQHMGVDMVLHEFNGTVTMGIQDFNLENGKFYVYKGYVWDGTGKDTSTKSSFSTVSYLYMKK